MSLKDEPRCPQCEAEDKPKCYQARFVEDSFKEIMKRIKKDCMECGNEICWEDVEMHISDVSGMTREEIKDD